MKLDIESNKKGTGIRLIGPIVVRMPETGESIISEGVVAGAIQIPGDGQPIIILGEQDVEDKIKMFKDGLF